MKKFVLTLTAVAAFGGSAAAADLPARVYTKAPPPLEAAYTWTGFYVGGNIGGGWSHDSGAPRCADGAGVPNGALCQNVPGSTINGSGLIGGGQIGYNWQVGPSWLLGVEADIQGADINGSTIVNGPFAFFGGGLAVPAAEFAASEKLDWFGTARGRVGAIIGPALVYVTGGLAYGHAQLDTKFTSPTAFPASAGVTRTGWTAGAGVEWGFTSNWSAKLEGLYYDLGTTTLTAGPVAPVGAGAIGFVRGKDFDLRGAIARVGLNYHFGGPVVAKY